MCQAIKIVVAGLGRAGKARVRDITANVFGENVVALKGIISRPLVWTETRATDSSSRTFTFHFTFEDGTTMEYSPRMGPPPRPTNGKAAPPKGLFVRDLELFLKKIRGEVAADEIEKEKKRTLHCAEIAGKIQELAMQKI
ncbi:Biliverdin reductase A [Exaiptasia diaphana]|nr:Biliverdin reductase A [Exaiptasia diaphana]